MVRHAESLAVRQSIKYWKLDCRNIGDIAYYLSLAVKLIPELRGVKTKSETWPFTISNFLNGAGFFIIMSYFLIYFTNEGFTSQEYSYIFASALISEAILMTLLPKLSQFANVRTLIILLYIIPGIGALFSVFSIAIHDILLIFIGFVIFILAGASWPLLAIYLKRISSNDHYTQVLNNSISLPLRVGYIVSAAISFSYLFFVSSLYNLLIFGALVVITSGLPFLIITPYRENLSKPVFRFRSFLNSFKYSIPGQIHYIFTPFLALFLYHYGFSLYFIGLLLTIRYMGGIALGTFISRIMDQKSSQYVFLTMVFLVISISLLLFGNLEFTLAALFLSGIGGPSSNLFYSHFSKTNKNELSDSSLFGVTSLIWSSVLILIGGFFIEKGFKTLFYSSLIISVIMSIILFFFLTNPAAILQKQHSKS